MTRYRILKDNNSVYPTYRVQTRPVWWPFWFTDSHFKHYDKPRRVERAGGLFGDIHTAHTSYGHMETDFDSEGQAKSRIKQLKDDSKSLKEEPAPTSEVVYKE